MSKSLVDKEKITRLLERGVETIEVRAHLEKRLLAGDKLRVKFGVDPTTPDLHLGHAVGLIKLRHWQELGHQVIFLIGDFTATIGDPSGRSEARPMLGPAQIEANWQSYQQQAGKILDMSQVEVRRNHEWYSGWSLAQLLELYAKFTVSRILERDDFTKRLKDGGELSMLELAYPMLQGYDSYELHADVELGGRDQLFNMLMGRKVQKRLGQEPQDVMTVPLLEGTDGIKKMSKSLGNYISVQENAAGMFGKLMSVPDQLIVKYLELLTELPLADIAQYRQQLASAAVNPKEVKSLMAKLVTALIWGEDQAVGAAAEFERVHTAGQAPQDLPTWLLKVDKINIIELLVQTKLTLSKSEARRLIDQKAVRVNDQTIADYGEEIIITTNPTLVNVGPTRFLAVKKSS